MECPNEEEDEIASESSSMLPSSPEWRCGSGGGTWFAVKDMPGRRSSASTSVPSTTLLSGLGTSLTAGRSYLSSVKLGSPGCDAATEARPGAGVVGSGSQGCGNIVDARLGAEAVGVVPEGRDVVRVISGAVETCWVASLI